MRNDDYVKNMIRRMLVKEGWVWGERKGFLFGYDGPVENCRVSDHRTFRWAGLPVDPPVITIGPDCEPRVLVDA